MNEQNQLFMISFPKSLGISARAILPQRIK